MKILVSWLREYVDVPVGIEDLARDLTMRGFEVASIDPVDGTEDDAVIDFEITANRPDCLSVVGMAREVSVRYGTPLRHPSPGAFSAGDVPLRVTIEAPDLCPLYVAALMDVQVAPSPDWLVSRLAHTGVRSINNIVDVTNYVLLELGQPLHAFDYETIGGRHLRIRTAAAGETLVTLDGQPRTLTSDMLVIADEHHAQAVAGVMGGAATEITAGTRTIALESAYFEPSQVRRTRRKLGLSTEASYRFERGTDPHMPVTALWRAVQLLDQIGAGTCRPGTVGAAARDVAPTHVTLRASRIERVLGMRVEPADVEGMLRGLGFSLAPEAGTGTTAWRVGVPGWRGDVTREVDLIEEVARCAGYDQLPVTFPALLVPPAPTPSRLARDRAVRDMLVGAGFAECVTFTFIERDAAAPFDAAPVAIANPLSENFAVLRPSLLPGVIDSVSHNRRREQQDIRLFEVGTRFTKAHGETRSIAVGWTGQAHQEHWSRSGRAVDLFDLLGLVERVGQLLRVSLRTEPGDHPALLDGRAVGVFRTGPDGDLRVGLAGQLLPALADSRGLPAHEPVLVAEIDLDLAAPDFAPDALVTMRPLPRFPSVVRDVSLLVPADLPAAIVRGTMQAAGPSTLVRVLEFDRYAGPSLPDGRVSLSFRLTFRDPERTLVDADIQAAMETILVAVREQHGAERR